MSLPITIPNTFATATGNIALSLLDADFVVVANGVNGIGNGTNSLVNVNITGGNVGNVTLTNLTVQSLSASSNAAAFVTLIDPQIPKFRAHPSVDQIVSANVATKIVLGTVDFDTNSLFSASRFTPNIAGYYIIQGSVTFSAIATTIATYIYKNGSQYSQATGTGQGVMISDIVSFNGSSDYVELFALQSAVGNLNALSAVVYFAGSRIT